mmetsp:Transcript_30393/g.69968  ORF Transcript_30393/g.69968 Transcript_30393/m.69968 type:complete len:207 (-) Transcript_30393:49-669(-)
MVKKSKSQKKKEAKKRWDENAEIDAETAQQVKELEERLESLYHEMNTMEGKIRRRMVEGKRATLAHQEVSVLPSNAVMYRQVGRSFLLSPKDAVTASLQAESALNQVEMQQMQQSKAKLEQKLKSEALSLQELIGPERMKGLFLNKGGDAKTSASVEDGKSSQSSSDELMPIYGAPRSDSKKEDVVDINNKVEEAEDQKPEEPAKQ